MLNVYTFNQGRNQFKLDEENEMRMLSEEITEFYEAKDLAERIDAIMDVKYVWNGTKMKYNANFKCIPEITTQLTEEFLAISSAIIVQEMNNNESGARKIMNDSWKIVCDANAMKSTNLDENGKVIKGNIPNATEQIRSLLKEVGL